MPCRDYALTPHFAMEPNTTSCPTTTLGTLYGIGVGPGSPDLLTLRAVQVLQHVDVILAAASPKNDGSLALSIAEPHLPGNCTVQRLDFPMTRDKEQLQAAWEANANTVIEIARYGKNAAFLTLGDPMIYSTFGYLMRTVRAKMDDLPIEVIPGITSYQEAAAKTRTILCEGEESLLLVSGVNKEDKLHRLLEAADSAVILKTYRNAETISRTLDVTGRSGQCTFATRIGLEGELFVTGRNAIPEKPHYLSLVLSPPERKAN